MIENLDLKELEKRAFKSTFQDGIWDMFLGMLLLCMSANILLPSIIEEKYVIPIFISLEIIALLFFIFGKKMITVPRLGNVKFGQYRKKKRIKVTIVLSASVVVGILAFFLSYEGITSLYMIAVLWSINCIVVFFLLANYLDYNGFYLTGVLYAIAFPGLFIIHDYAKWQNYEFLSFAVPGIILLGFGTYKLKEFLKKYPKFRAVA